MGVRDWSPRRVRNLWIFGLLIEGALLVIPSLVGGISIPVRVRSDWRRDSAHLLPLPPGMWTVGAIDDLRQRDGKALDSMGIHVDSSHDSLIYRVNDSMIVSFPKRRDSLAGISFSAAAARAAQDDLGYGSPFRLSLMTSYSTVLHRLFSIVAVGFLPVPLLLISITVVWALVRR